MFWSLGPLLMFQNQNKFGEGTSRQCDAPITLLVCILPFKTIGVHQNAHFRRFQCVSGIYLEPSFICSINGIISVIIAKNAPSSPEILPCAHIHLYNFSKFTPDFTSCWHHSQVQVLVLWYLAFGEIFTTTDRAVLDIRCVVKYPTMVSVLLLFFFHLVGHSYGYCLHFFVC